MPVSIPRLNRIEPSSNMPQNDRLNMQVKDQGAQIMQQTGQATKLANEGAEIYQQYENDKIEQLSASAELEFTNWNNQELARLKSFQGDPTDAYVEYDKKVMEKREELINARPDLNERVKRHFTSRVDKTLQKQNVASLKQRGAQVEAYKNNLYEASVKLKKNQLPELAGLDDYMFDEGIHEIKSTISKRALEQGTATEVIDSEGNTRIKLSEIAKARMSKELDEGVRETINVLISTPGQEEKAKEYAKKYDQYLSPKSKAAIEKKFGKVDLKNQAFEVIGSLKGDESEKVKQIEKLREKNPELASKVLSLKEADDAKLASQKTRMHKVNYDLAQDRVEELRKAGQLHGTANIENDPVIEKLWDNLDHKSRKALLEEVKQPEVSDENSLLKIQNLFLGDDPTNEIETIDPKEFRQYLSNLSKKDRARYEKKFEIARKSGLTQDKGTNKRAKEFMFQFLYQDKKYIKEDFFGKLDRKSKQRINEANDELIDALAAQPKFSSEKQLKDFVKSFSAAKIKGERFSPPERTRFRADATDSSNPFDSLEIEAQRRLKTSWKNGPGRGSIPDSNIINTPEFKKFMEENKYGAK